jgi:hypothetical protein
MFIILILEVPLGDLKVVYSILIGNITMGIPNLKNLF